MHARHAHFDIFRLTPETTPSVGKSLHKYMGQNDWEHVVLSQYRTLVVLNFHVSEEVFLQRPNTFQMKCKSSAVVPTQRCQILYMAESSSAK